jgi:sialic acid synthase SpsE
MVAAVRVAEKAIGKINYDLTEKEEASRVFRRSLFVVKDITAGEAFTRDNVRSIRPGYGLPVRVLQQILGKKAAIPIVRGTPLSNDLIR